LFYKGFDMSIVLVGSTSGSVTLQEPAVAGSTVVNLPSVSMNIGQGGSNVATNTAFGASALAANTTGLGNTSVGYQALDVSTTSDYHTAVGWNALGSNTTGARNTAFGAAALATNSTGGFNVAMGVNAGYAVTTGSYNVALGYDSLSSNTTASNNTAVGYQAGYSNTTYSYNTYLGFQAGYFANGGTYNCFVGLGAGYFVTTGTKNTILGGFSGNQGGLDIRSANNHIVLSDGDGNPRFLINAAATGTNRLVFDGNQLYPSNDNGVALGFSANRWTVVYATTGTINTSDENQKQDITSLDDAEKRVAIAIKSLIKKYRFKDAVAKKGDSARIHVGVVAQEVQAAFVAEGLDPARYALFCSDTWYEVDGKAAEPATPYTAETPNAVEVTQLGLRYEELLAFVIAAM
jgi:hypothetical protein